MRPVIKLSTTKAQPNNSKLSNAICQFRDDKTAV
ncbi:hypothetical protein ACVWW3_002694 [Bradyrhizobium sp. LM2.9]